MKKLKIFSLMAFAAAGLFAQAQESTTGGNAQSDDLESLRDEVQSLRSELNAQKDKDVQRSVWGRQKALKIGYVDNTWTPEAVDGQTLAKLKPNYGFSLGLTKTYFLHPKAIAGCLKFGLDVTWFDISYVNYKANPNWSDNVGGDYDDLPDFDVPNLGSNQIDAGVGIGVSANVTPFFFSNSTGVKSVRAKLYCNFLPSYSAMIISEDGDNQVNHAFVPYFTYGINLQWKALSFFIEGRHGSANYKINSIELDYGSLEGGWANDKVSCSNSGYRAGIGLCF